MKDKLSLCRHIRITDKDRKVIEDITDKDFDEDAFVDSIIGFEDIMRGNSNSTEQYIKAIQFASYVGLGMSQTEAYSKCFPDRAMKKISQGEQVLSSASSTYANGKLVKDITQRMYLHNNLLFLDKEFKARKKLFEIGMSGDSKTNVEALKVFLDNQYREKDKSGFNMQVNFNDNSGVTNLNDALTKLAERQSTMIERDMITLKEVAESKIVDKED